MATLQFGNATTKTANNYIKELQAVVGEQCPLTVEVANGILQKVTVETEWREGGTVPVEVEMEVEKKNAKGEKEIVTELVVVDYEESYVEKALTQKQIKDLNTYIEANIQQ